MRTIKFCKIYFILLILFGSVAFAKTQALYDFEKPEDHVRFYKLSQELRCLVCQNENLLDSNAPLAKDLRQEVASMIKQGKTDVEIKSYLTNRYGAFVLYQPPFNRQSIALWLFPFISLVVMISGYVIFACYNYNRKAQ